MQSTGHASQGTDSTQREETDGGGDGRVGDGGDARVECAHREHESDRDARTQQSSSALQRSNADGKRTCREDEGARAEPTKKPRRSGSGTSSGAGSSAEPVPRRAALPAEPTQEVPSQPEHEPHDKLQGSASLKRKTQRGKEAESEIQTEQTENPAERGASKRPRRAGVPVVNYSETRRRAAPAQRRRKSAPSQAYMDASGATGGRITLHRAIEVGSVTIDRIVGGRYEWRDAA